MSFSTRTTDRELRVVWCKYQNLLFDHHNMKTNYEYCHRLDVWEQIRIDILSKRNRELAELKNKRYFDIHHKSVHPPNVGDLSIPSSNSSQELPIPPTR